MSERREPPSGLPDPQPDDDPQRGAHNELGFFSQDEEAPKDERAGPAAGEGDSDDPG